MKLHTRTAITALAALSGVALLALPSRAAPTGGQGQFTYTLDCGSIAKGQPFVQLTGLGSETEVVEHKIVGPNGQELVQKIPGRLHVANLRLKRALGADASWWRWRQDVVDGKIPAARCSGGITVTDATSRAVVARFDFQNAWPAALNETHGPGEPEMEELTLAIETFRRR